MSAPSALPRIVVVGTGPASVRAAQAPVHATTDFQALQNAFERARVEDIQYFVFDLPSFRGHDLRQVPLAVRRALLNIAT
ncbi:hypothetical protein [Cupriavidus sp. CuC1]|uniref:hypothetical protein n=1 Tax=Cupriavidus sp. CuC1 TaxID=3373131 RepID=UPI0037D97A03